MSKKSNEQHVDIIDHPQVYRWLKELARTDPEAYAYLVGSSPFRLIEIWGDPQWRNDGSKGWTHAWGVSEQGLNWLVTAGDQGIAYRLRVPTDGEDYLADVKVSIGAIAFLKQLIRKLSPYYEGTT